MRPDSVIASNTSAIPIKNIAQVSARPERVVGMHFCLPAQLMRLIEMSPGILTSDETFSTAWEWTKACNQIPVKTQDKPGFILNARYSFLLIPLIFVPALVLRLKLEEAALLQKFGETYRAYQKTTPAIFPIRWPRTK